MIGKLNCASTYMYLCTCNDTI